MTINVGQSTLQDLIAARNLSFAAFGIDTIERVLAADQMAWNTLVRDLEGDITEVSEDQQRILGASANNNMKEVDELGRAETQRGVFGPQVAFPLRHWQYNLGWTREWFKNHTPADMAIAVQAGQKAHQRQLFNDMQKGIFRSANYTFVDYTKKSISFTIRRLWNADGSAIPDGPHGETFNGATHTHYTAINGLTAAAATAVGNNVLEHRITPDVRLAINALDAATVTAALGAGYVAMVDPRMTLQFGTGIVPTERLDIATMNDRQIGIFTPYPLWVKPWVPQGYMVAYDTSAPEKPVVRRVDPGSGGPNLELVQSIDRHPLHYQFQESYFGHGIFNRGAMAVLYFGGSAWVDPTIN